MTEALLSFAKKHALLEPGDRILVALSGGADSTCLLHLLTQTEFEIGAAHLNHTQRPEGEADSEYCRKLCEELGIRFYAGKANVPEVARLHKIGIEEAGRNLRYEFLQRVASLGYNKIATGHTMNDNLESMLINLARGTGMTGLSGIPPKRDNIIRPILFLKRLETESYCAANELQFLQDSCNEDEGFARNLIRKHVVPILQTVNSGAVDRAAVTAGILAEEDVLLNALAAAHLEANEIQSEGPLAFLESKFESRWRTMPELPIALVRRCIRIAASMYGVGMGHAATQALAGAMHRGEKASFTAEGGSVTVTTSIDKWAVTVVEPAQTFRQVITLPGETISDDLGWSLAAWQTEPPEGEVDADAIKGPLYARSLRSGDKINPVGRGTARSLAERLSRAGVGQAVRSRLPIVCDMIGPVWAPVVGVDRRCGLMPGARRAIALRLGPIEHTPGNSTAV